MALVDWLPWSVSSQLGGQRPIGSLRVGFGPTFRFAPQCVKHLLANLIGALAVQSTRTAPPLKAIAYTANYRCQGVTVQSGELPLAKEYSLVGTIIEGFCNSARDGQSSDAHGAIPRGYARVEMTLNYCRDLLLLNYFFCKLQAAGQKYDVSENRLVFVYFADRAER
jgi:hypothetical protein